MDVQGVRGCIKERLDATSREREHYQLSATLGVIPCPPERQESLEELLAQADAAM